MNEIIREAIEIEVLPFGMNRGWVVLEWAMGASCSHCKGIEDGSLRVRCVLPFDLVAICGGHFKVC
jgi:hypothetical protein